MDQLVDAISALAKAAGLRALESGGAVHVVGPQGTQPVLIVTKGGGASDFNCYRPSIGGGSVRRDLNLPFDECVAHVKAMIRPVASADC